MNPTVKRASEHAFGKGHVQFMDVRSAGASNPGAAIRSNRNWRTRCTRSLLYA